MYLPTVNHSPRNNATDRRAFLQRASLMTIAAAGMTATSVLSAADDEKIEEPAAAATGPLAKLTLGVKPSIDALGAVVVPRARNTYVSFHATQFGEDGNPSVNGTAVLEFAMCVERKFRSKGDEATAEHAIDLESLDVCECYEVLESSWANKWNQLPDSNSDSEPRVRHFIFTFLGYCPGVCSGTMHFECLATDVNAHFLGDTSFEETLQFIDSLESVGA
ncbi:hypothetical protein [Novipirellula caenicola]|uniref:Twin-arginine translocation signal domain-containing protein n=1 Tax=Novipirellula caenicola TaxID=1536901 RepID=A0ABP9VKN4_9BACT